ncbi:nitrate/nitrite transporter NrtS [Ferrovibrio sp.]|uniref:nitrate/nitrite transporter NrtS n=1 Tax=Ferrovibrio sp. TaxID=1917215 RepID=UPI00260F2AF1|nr:nitrate/nitrite transporter NrtS [Ferrovibrio sp.]
MLFLRVATTPRIVATAAKVSFVVGTVLNLVNQGGRLLDDAPINWLQFLLNYVVPYCVSTYSAVRNELSRRDGDIRP